MGSCRVVVIAFDTYYDISLKNAIWASWKCSTFEFRCLDAYDAFDISDASLKEILSHTGTK